MTRGRLGLVILLAFVTLGTGAQGERTGAWVDQVIFSEVPDLAAAVDLLLAGELDLYVDHFLSPANPQVLSTVVQNLPYQVSYSVYFELTFNPAGPEFADGRLNPFSVPTIREAMNWLIDREYIVDSVFGGIGAIPRYFPIHPGSPDYQRYIETCRALEREYAPDPARARAVITREMRALGAELVDGIWHYHGQPVEIIFLIRVEDQRREIGDYVADLLEDVGFVVRREYKTAHEASPCWLFPDPAEGCFHIYTGGWLSEFPRHTGEEFEFFYLPEGLPSPLWQGYRPAPEFDEVARRLARLDFTTLEERGELFRQVLRFALEDSVRVWLVHLRRVTPYRSGLQLSVSPYVGLRYTWAWPLTLQWQGEDRPVPGGTVTVGISTLSLNRWNAVWYSVHDGAGRFVLKGTVDLPLLQDPRTGLYWPQRVERAEVVTQEGLPVVKTLDWVTLEFVPEIRVPKDAWVDWDAAAQRFITAGEKFPEGLTAPTKVTVHYPLEFFTTHWHDGSCMSLADCLLGFIMLFDRAEPDSPIYDESATRGLEWLLGNFRGLRILGWDPLVFEVYRDLVELDAELLAAYAAALLYPFHQQHRPRPNPGPRVLEFTAPWHSVAIGILAEAAGELTFTPQKARDLGVEQMNYLSGPTLPILERYLRQALEQSFIPYAPTLGEYITQEEARQRYQNLLSWYEEHGHLWVGNGPFYLDSLGEEQVVLKRFPDYPGPADKWLFLTQWDLPQVEIRGPERVTIGGRTGFLVDVRRNGELMPMDEVLEVRYLLIGADGEVVAAGLAQPLTAGQWQVTLGPEATENLSQGEGKLIVLVFLPGCPEVPQATHTFQAVTG
ncbi:MAG TPA: ABC transporter substrate-binding protein [Candidatus Acetothermia bacterium]|nr:ABC transporter substrate-binding protein [Candidatus Acetothermia bacterium]